MPFTLSHAAAVLPFSRPLARWRMLSAAIIGSMVPDSRVFLPWQHLQRFETHSAMSLFTFSLPLGLGMYWLFQYLIKLPMIEVLPDGAYARWRSHEGPAPITSPMQWLLAACGIIVGAFSHLVLDAFTHEGARGVRMLPFQDETVVDIGRYHMGFALAMQDIGSLVGLVAVLVMIAYGLRRGREAAIVPRILSPAERQAWTWSIVLGSLVLGAVFLRSDHLLGPNHGGLVYDSAIASLRALATAAILFAAAIQWRLRTLATRTLDVERR